MTDSFTQKNTVSAARDRVFEAIADSDVHSTFTGAPAELPAEAGARFTTHGGAIEGQLLEVVAGERIVQAWRPADWPAGVYSLVRYDFASVGEETEITLTHSSVPADAAEHLQAGWQQMYWGPLGEHFA